MTRSGTLTLHSKKTYVWVEHNDIVLVYNDNGERLFTAPTIPEAIAGIRAYEAKQAKRSHLKLIASFALALLITTACGKPGECQYCETVGQYCGQTCPVAAHK